MPALTCLGPQIFRLGPTSEQLAQLGGPTGRSKVAGTGPAAGCVCVCMLRGAQGLSHTAPYMLVRAPLSFQGGTRLPPRLTSHGHITHGPAH
jgi:hypothetical protein